MTTEGDNVTVSGPSGVLTSPGYPQDYPYDYVSTTYITTGPGTAVRITFDDFDIDNRNDEFCGNDHLLVSIDLRFNKIYAC